jgi:hypothetical protein
VQNPHDILLVFLYKRIQGVVCWSRCFLLHETVLLHEPRPVSSRFKVRGSKFKVQPTPSSMLPPPSSLCSSYQRASTSSIAALPRCAFCASSRQRGFPHLSRQVAHFPSNRLRPVVFQAGLKTGLCPAPASSGPVCPGIAMLPPHCLAARPLPPAPPVADRAKPPEYRQNLPVDPLRQDWQDGAVMNESEKQFSFTRAALSTGGRAKSKFLSVGPCSPIEAV